MNKKEQIEKTVRRTIIFFMVALALSGLTAFAIETELEFILKNSSGGNGVYQWLSRVHYATKQVNIQFPFMAYGYDWLAFAHLVIAVAFIGPLKEPVRNIWIIEFGRIACIMIFPLAFIAGYIRGIPFGWQMIDCSFGILGYITLTFCYNKIRLLEKWNDKNVHNLAA